jgi:3-phenylpropionate/cinnamic acid dioxygenase small subunit
MSLERSNVRLADEDRWAIAETLALHGHLFDNGELDRLEELFTPDVIYDVTDVGMRALHGISEILRATLELGDGNPLAHHVTNITITEVTADHVSTRCKAIVVLADGRSGSATYVDSLRRDDGRWKISHRMVQARRIPLNGAHIT